MDSSIEGLLVYSHFVFLTFSILQRNFNKEMAIYNSKSINLKYEMLYNLCPFYFILIFIEINFLIFFLIFFFAYFFPFNFIPNVLFKCKLKVRNRLLCLLTLNFHNYMYDTSMKNYKFKHTCVYTFILAPD